MKKKELLLFAAAATMLTACVNTDNFKEISEVESPIDFSTFTTRQTKAENSTASSKEGLENYNTHFKVWGYKNAKNAAGTANVDTYVFGETGNPLPGTVVHYDESTTSWAYKPLRFWDKSANYYRFYAASPANQNWIFTSTAGSEKIQLNNFNITGENRVLEGNSDNTAVDKPLGVSAGTSADEIDAKATLSDLNNEDLMISTDITNHTTYTSDAVNLEFNHILSRLNIGVRKSKELANYDVKLNTIEIHNLVKQASFDEGKTITNCAYPGESTDEGYGTRAYMLKHGTADRWTIDQSGEPAADIRFTDNRMRYSGNPTPLPITATEPTSGSANLYQYVFQGLVIPQSLQYEQTVASTASGFKMDGSTASSYPTKAYIVIDYEIWTKEEAARKYAADDPEVILGQKTTDDDRPLVASKKIDGYKYFYNLSEVFNGSASKDIVFCEGYQNTLKITLKPIAIVFDAEVYHWDNGTIQTVDIQ